MSVELKYYSLVISKRNIGNDNLLIFNSPPNSWFVSVTGSECQWIKNFFEINYGITVEISKLHNYGPDANYINY